MKEGQRILQRNIPTGRTLKIVQESLFIASQERWSKLQSNIDKLEATLQQSQQ